MKYTRLGCSPLWISAIGFGCMSLGKEEAENSRLIHRALELGINFFDTADLYDKGLNERQVGNILRSKRDQVVLATKVGNQWRSDGSGWDWNPRKEYIIRAAEASLTRLQTDRIDLYQLHGGTIEDPIDEILEAFELLQQQGKIRCYGISSIRPHVIRKYVMRSGFPGVESEEHASRSGNPGKTAGSLVENPYASEKESEIKSGENSTGSDRKSIPSEEIPGKWVIREEDGKEKRSEGAQEKLALSEDGSGNCKIGSRDPKDGWSGIVSVMLQYSLLDRRAEAGVLPLLQKKGIGVLARGPLAKGLLVDKPAAPYLNFGAEEVARAAGAILSLSGTNRNSARTALRFVLDNPIISSAVTGLRTMEQLEESAGAIGASRLTSEEMDTLRSMLPVNSYDPQL